jgi:hypothetical protein
MLLIGKTSESGTNLSELKVEDDPIGFQPYHKGQVSRPDGIPLERRTFIAWDGEGANRDGIGKPQAYTLFGCSTGDYVTSPGHLHTFEALDFIVRIGKANPGAIHVGFAFSYDANMILQSLSEGALRKLHEKGHITLQRKTVGRYHIQFRPGKWFSVSRYAENYDRKTNPHAKVTVRIYDLFGFFAKSFIKAYEELIGPIPEVVAEGKAARGQFDRMDSSYVERYWRAEIEMLRQLAEELRRRLYGAGLRISQWHGPGALASYALRERGVKKHMATCPDEVREAASYAYAGGRFEMFRLGRVEGPIYSVDINSAYPFGITKLPSLSAGTWQHVRSPERIAKFGVYRVRLLPQRTDTFFERAPGPLFHRDYMGNISFPWVVEGWYWSPEVLNLKRLRNNRYEIVEGWEYIGGRLPHQDMPFYWVNEMYQKRREWKRKGLASQLALKLCMNSLYGKMAQRVGWDEEKRKPPTWHQLEWAGWVTSNTRAMLWDVMSRIPTEKIIAVETDGLYTTMHPDELGIQHSEELGGWDVSTYDEILYVQSGMAWLRKGDTWTTKRRGLDARTFALSDCIDYLGTLEAGSEWKPFLGETTRFIGVGAALNSNAPFKVRHCVWETKIREIKPGQGGKRVHIHGQCYACRAGATAYEAAHDMSIRSLAYKSPRSFKHDIPWEDDGNRYAWRDHELALGESVV